MINAEAASVPISVVRDGRHPSIPLGLSTNFLSCFISFVSRCGNLFWPDLPSAVCSEHMTRLHLLNPKPAVRLNA